MMKTTFALSLALVLVLSMSSCQRKLELVPDEGRRAPVAPQKEGRVKAWNGIIKQEGDAVRGPMSDMRR